MAHQAMSHGDYTIAWICALPLEMAAAKLMLDEFHESLPQPVADQNCYTLGSVHGHNIVIACLPSGVHGTISATIVLPQMLPAFPALRFGLMVGIGGDVPTKADVRLGDVVVGIPNASSSGVIQSQFGKTMHSGRFQRIGLLNKPPQVLLAAVSQVRSAFLLDKGSNEFAVSISNVLEKGLGRGKGYVLAQGHAIASNPVATEPFARPDEDRLFISAYTHSGPNNDCAACDQNQLVYREPRGTSEPHIHFGLIASGNQVMKDARTHDSIAQDWTSYGHLRTWGNWEDSNRFELANPRDIPQSLLRAPTYRKQRIDALGLLKAYSFITEQTGKGAIALHRLVYLATRNWMRKDGIFASWMLKTVDRIAEVFPGAVHTKRDQWGEYLPHVLSMTMDAEFRAALSKYHNLLREVGWCLYRNGRCEEAKGVLADLLEDMQNTLGKSHVATLATISALRVMLTELGELDEARQLQEQAVEGPIRLDGPNHSDTPRNPSVLGQVYHNQGKFEKARLMQQQALQGLEKELGHDDRETLASLTNLGSDLLELGRYDEAASMYELAMERYTRVHGPDHPDALTAASNLAALLLYQGNYEMAEKAHRRALHWKYSIDILNPPSWLLRLQGTPRLQDAWFIGLGGLGGLRGP
ncbi:hypothetical protein BDV10DRAFT_190388 [Aspergillus recurvatus]